MLCSLMILIGLAQAGPTAEPDVLDGASPHLTHGLAADADNRSRNNAWRVHQAQIALRALEAQVDNACPDMDGEDTPDPDCVQGLQQEIQALWDELASMDRAISSTLQVHGERLDAVELTLYGDPEDDTDSGLVGRMDAMEARAARIEATARTARQDIDRIDRLMVYGLTGVTGGLDFQPDIDGISSSTIASSCLTAGVGFEDGRQGYLLLADGCAGTSASFAGSLAAIAYRDGLVQLGGGIGYTGAVLDAYEPKYGAYTGAVSLEGWVGYTDIPYGLVAVLRPSLSFGKMASGSDAGTYWGTGLGLTVARRTTHD